MLSEEGVKKFFQNKLIIKKNITLDKVKESKPEMVFYSANTGWWTHDPNDICKGIIPLPHDSRGAVLMQSPNVKDFIGNAEKNSDHYGEHKLEAFIASHHQNSFSLLDPNKHWCSSSWQDYNDAISFDKAKAAGNEPIPNNLLEAIEYLLRNSDAEFIKKVSTMPEDDFSAFLHHTVGRTLRNKWDLWGSKADQEEKEHTGIRKYFVELGIEHADDISGIIIKSFYRLLSNKSIELEKQIGYYKDFWKKQIKN